MKKQAVILLLICIGAGLIALLVLKQKSEQTPAPDNVVKKPVGESVDPTKVDPALLKVRQEKADKEAVKHQAEIVKKLRQLKMSPAVREIIAFDKDGSNRKARFDAMKKLTRVLSIDDTEALSLFLDMRFEDQENLGNMKLISYNAIKNNALEVLTRQKTLPEGLSSKLVQMYKDVQHDDMWRGYCVQYFAQCYKDEQAKGKPDEEVLKSIEDSYWQAADEKENVIAGTALLALERLSVEQEKFDRRKVEGIALDLVTSDQCDESSKITALRICAKMGEKDVLPSARVIAQAGDTVMLRQAAIATLGDIGDESDVELLESFSDSSEKRINVVAKAAYERLSKSLEKSSEVADSR